MALRNIIMEGDPVLKKVCRPVTKFDDRLAQLLDDMAETMMEANGLGLAAPQVGIRRRCFVMVEESSLPPLHEDDGDEAEGAEGADDAAAEPDEGLEMEFEPVIIELVNPEIIATEGEQEGYEGCLSFPGQMAAIKRPQKARVRAQDRNGDWFEYEGEGIMARCICHENNHLDGVTIDDLAEYFYDPDEPHPLDERYEGGGDEGGAEESGE